MTRRIVLLVEVDIEGQRWSSTDIQQDLNYRLEDEYGDITVWGCLDGVDSTFRKLRQLARETEDDASKADRIHSAYKAMSFFRDIFPTRFWKDKRIGGEHPAPGEPRIAGR